MDCQSIDPIKATCSSRLNPSTRVRILLASQLRALLHHQNSETVCHLRCADLLDLETQRLLIDDVHTQKTQLTYETASRISGTLSLHTQEIDISDTYIKLNIRRAARYI